MLKTCRAYWSPEIGCANLLLATCCGWARFWSFATAMFLLLALLTLDARVALFTAATVSTLAAELTAMLRTAPAHVGGYAYGAVTWAGAQVLGVAIYGAAVWATNAVA